ncbi:hypothetical protein [Methylophaga thalassica]|uniref:hypothetical protein n=1 Tax=Methylophaga thalassica TaxID=40223 RepID=UPI002E7B7153|nr:hypothetical protein [Methylophaga thalassica]WVI83644.1 hypothetical protein VSX76_00935 [Methylophaga thalassica]
MLITEITISTDEPTEKQICELYWQEDDNGKYAYKVKEIIEKTAFNGFQINHIVKKNSAAVASWWPCSRGCKRPYRFYSRSELDTAVRKFNRGNLEPWVCTHCYANELIERGEREIAVRKKKCDYLLSNLKKLSESPIDINRLNGKEIVYLLALLRHSGSEDLTQINPIIENKSDRLAPTHLYSLRILNYLSSQDIICVSPKNDLAKIVFDEDDQIRFSPESVEWLIPLSDGTSIAQLYKDLEEKVAEPNFYKENEEDLVNIEFLISEEECIEYLYKVTNTHNLSFSVGEKTRTVLSKCLETYSVSQTFSFIWNSGRNAASFYMSHQVPKKYAANTMPGFIQRQSERALTNDWDVTGFRRDYDLKQSSLSRVVFNTVLRTDDGGFDRALPVPVPD